MFSIIVIIIRGWNDSTQEPQRSMNGAFTESQWQELQTLIKDNVHQMMQGTNKIV